jgi:hypothetical protein
MTQITLGPFIKGMNNKLSDRALPPDKLYNAINVLFDDAGLIHFPGWGKTKIYNGTNIHSLSGMLFVENGSLKILNRDNTATVLRSNIGNTPCFYTTIADTTYFCNQVTTGKFKGGIVSEWGVDRPAHQPDCNVSSIGGMFAGNYRLALTFIGSDGIESGTGMGRRIAVPDGAGIRVDNIPAMPDYVTGFKIYVSSVNGKDMYWYGSYDKNISYVHIGRLNQDGVIPTIPCAVQFAYKPKPTSLICEHLGRVYMAQGNKLYYTEAHNPNLQKPFNYFEFDGDIKTLQSAPPFLFVHTDEALFSVTQIDTEGVPPQLNRIKNYSATFGASVHGKDDNLSFSYTDNGFIQVNGEDGSVSQLTYDENALPLFETGTIGLIEQDGTKYLIFSATDGVQNPLANAEYNTAELARLSL